MKWRKSDSPPAEDRFEEWFNRKRQESILGGQLEAPQGPCPDDSFLRDLARKSRSINLSDPRVDHAASCPLCMCQRRLKIPHFAGRKFPHPLGMKVYSSSRLA